MPAAVVSFGPFGVTRGLSQGLGYCDPPLEGLVLASSVPQISLRSPGFDTDRARAFPNVSARLGLLESFFGHFLSCLGFRSRPVSRSLWYYKTRRRHVEKESVAILWPISHFPLILCRSYLLRDLFLTCMTSVPQIPRSSPTLSRTTQNFCNIEPWMTISTL